MPRILIVDDTDFDRNLLRNILLSAGYAIAGAATGGIEGVQMYQDLIPDLVMVDLIMPDLNGIEVLRQIRDGAPDAKVMICTTVGNTAMVELSRRLGARGYVVKPYQAVTLINAVKRVIGPPDNTPPLPW
ncbi:MAG TPA: response regulator [Methanospirillum sp.]|nr:response regulator [Methanospirillum sp.]